MSTKKKNTTNNKNNKNNDVVGIIYVIISSFFLICLVTPLLSDIGIFVKNITTGLLGYTSYPIALCTLFYGILLLMNKKANLSRKQITFVVLLSVCAVLILQTAIDSNEMQGGLGEYISAIFSIYVVGNSVGGIVFGVFAYLFKAVLSFVGAYILYSLLFVLFAALLILDARGQKKTAVSQNAKPQSYAFIKGKSSAQPVRDVNDTTLFVGTIERNNNSKVSSLSGDFNSIYSPIDDSMHRYGEVSADSNAREYNVNQTRYSNAEDEQRQQAINKLFGSNESVRKNYDELLKSNMNIREHTSGRSNYLIEDDQIIKPIPHVSAPKINNETPNKKNFPDVPVPPEKDVSDQFVAGPILNGEEISKNIKDESRESSRFERFNEEQKEDSIVSNRIDETASVYEKPIVAPKLELEQVDGLPPILNGDLFTGKQELKVENDIQNQPYFAQPQDESKESVSVEDDFEQSQTESLHSTFDELNNEISEENESYSERYIEESYNVNPIIAGSDNTYIQDDDSVLDLKIDESDSEDEIVEDAIIYESQSKDNSYVEDNGDIEDSSYIEDNSNVISEDEQAYPEAKIPDSLKLIDEEIDMSETREEIENDNTGYYVSEGFNKNVGEISLKLNDAKMGIKKNAGVNNQINMDDYDVVLPESSKPKKKKKHLRYTPPPIDMLINNSTPYAEGEDCEENAKVLEESLRDLKIGAKVINILKGPAVIRYELEMPLGQSVNKITNRRDDIAYALAAPGKIRIEAPIKGKRAVGVEVPVPKDKIATVSLREIVDSKEFETAESALTLALGKGITGNIMTCDLEKMPHLLIAGTTGSGKSACLNCIIVSMLYKSSPDDVRIILIDPKRVEFANFRDIPHLLMKNIINDSVQACNAFRWARDEMERRYAIFAHCSVKNLSEYNACAAVKSGVEPKIPRIVIILDELADIMLSKNSKDLEQNIMSLAQKARAAGIHLILATQRPSVDVITGTIKANFPSRIAFAVKSIPDSRTILDQIGAESLCGRGDMLYAPIDSGDDPIRVQGAFVTTEEVVNIVNFVRENNEVDYDEAVENIIMKKQEEEVSVSFDEDKGGEQSEDPLMKDVLRRVIESKTASASQIQRRFSVGYNRASRILDQMEEKGYVGPMDGSKPREVYITSEKFREIYGEDV